MAIEFACPKCARGYSVKDELAGKSAKCGQCGHKMKIPTASAQVHVAATHAPAPKSAAVKSSPAKLANASKPVASKSIATAQPTKSTAPAAKSLAKGVTARTTAVKSPPAQAPPVDNAMRSWLDEELESSHAAVSAKPAGAPAAATGACPSCDAPLAEGAVLCVKCGYDTRTHGRRKLQHVEEDDVETKPSRLAGVASLLRGTLFSFIGALIGAFIWAVLAYLTDRQFGIVAWGLGGLAGLGMALGHDDGDGTIAGIIAAFMSLVGIVAAKVFIVVIVIAAVINEAALEFQQLDPVEFQRSELADELVLQELKASGETTHSVDDARLEALSEKAGAEVADLSPQEIQERLDAIADESEAAGGVVAGVEDEGIAAEQTVDEQEAAETLAEADELEAAPADDQIGFISIVGMLFGPMDAIFILFAFFTAYKVGSGEMSD